MVIRQALLSLKDRFIEAGIENAINEARHLLCAVLGLSLSALMLRGEEPLTSAQEAETARLAQRRVEGEPLAYVLGTADFYGRSFAASPAVLIPRPETEQLVEEALARLPKGGRFFDLCTGSGCIGISLAAERKDATGLACDISHEALKIAEANAKTHRVTERLQFHRHDLLSGLPDWGKADLIVSNPPYILREALPTLDAEVIGREPTLALDGGEDGLDFYRVLASAGSRLKSGGWLLLEIGYDQKTAVEDLLQQSGTFVSVTTKPDYAGLDRMVLAQRGPYGRED